MKPIQKKKKLKSPYTGAHSGVIRPVIPILSAHLYR